MGKNINNMNNLVYVICKAGVICDVSLHLTYNIYTKLSSYIYKIVMEGFFFKVKVKCMRYVIYNFYLKLCNRYMEGVYKC